MTPEQELEHILTNCKVRLDDINITMFTWPGPFSTFFSRKRGGLVQILKRIEEIIRKRAEPYEEDIEKFREVGGYFLINEVDGIYHLENILETTGDVIACVVFPGKGLTLTGSSNLPLIRDLDIDFDNARFLINYHSHPFFWDVQSDNDISFGKENLKFIPTNVRYVQVTYRRHSHKFSWLEYSSRN